MYPYSPSHLVYTSVHDQKADQRIQRKDFPGIHLDVHRYPGKIFPLNSLIYPLINKLVHH